MTLPRLDAMQEYWRRNPPVHQLVAAYMQYKAPEKEKTAIGNIDELIAAFGGSNVR